MADVAPAKVPAASTESDADRKARERVERLLARPASESSGSLAIGGRTLDYQVSAAFVPVSAGLTVSAPCST